MKSAQGQGQGQGTGKGWSLPEPLVQETHSPVGGWSSLLVFLTCFACLAPVWLLPGVYWDGWIYEVALERGLIDPVIDAYRDNGRTLQGVALLAFSVFESPSRAANIAGCSASALAGMFLYIILSAHLRLPRLYAGAAAVLGVIHPAYLTLISLSMIAFPLSLPLFWGGMLLVISGQGGLGARPSVARVVVGGGLILVSFVGEVGVFMTPILGAIWLLRGLMDGLGLRGSLNLAFRHAWWTPLLSAGGAVAIALLFPLAGEYQGARLVDSTLETYVSFIKLYLGKPFDLLLWGVWIATAVLALFLVFSRRLPRLNGLLFLGAISFAFSVSPYVLAHRGPLNDGWQARFFLFSALPIGMMVSGFCMAIAASIPRGWPKWLALPLPLVFCAVQMGSVIDQSLTWNARWTRDAAIIEALASLPTDVGLVLFEDRYPAPFGETLRWYEWQAIGVTGAGRFDLVAASLQTAQDNGMDPTTVAAKMASYDWSSGLLHQPVREKCVFYAMDSSSLIGADFSLRRRRAQDPSEDVSVLINLRRLPCPRTGGS